MPHARLLRLLGAVCLLVPLTANVPAAGPVQATGPQAAGAWYVATTGSDAANCATPATPCATINAAIGKAAGGDTVYVAAGTYTGTGDQVVLVDRSLTLSGGWADDFTAQTAHSIVDGELTRRGLVTTSGTHVRVEQFHIRGGYGVNIAPYHYRGGGIYSASELELDRSIVSDSTSLGGAGLFMADAAALTMTRSVIRNNLATLNQGGGIELSGGTTVIRDSAIIFNTAACSGGIHGGGGHLVIENTTISGNRALGFKNCYAFGGGLAANMPGEVWLYNVTISDNWADSAGGGLVLSSLEPGELHAQNTIIARNGSPIGPDCYTDQRYSPDVQIASGGYNLLQSDRDCTVLSSSGDQIGADPKLLAVVPELGYAALAADSPAIDRGAVSACTDHLGAALNTDQRGASRVGRCDIGAYEYHLPGPADRIVPLEAAPRSASILSFFGAPLQVFAVDKNGSPAVSGVVEFQAPTGGASGAFGDTGTVTTTAPVMSGIATASAFRANSLIGSYVITASLNNSVVPFSLTNETPRVYLPASARTYCTDFFDDFSGPTTRWYTGDDGYGLVHIVDAQYRVYTYASDLYLIAAPTCPFQNYMVEADVRWAEPSANSYGLLFGLAPYWTQFYFLDVNPKYQGLRLFHYDDASGFRLAAGPLFTSFIAPETRSNRLSVLYKNSLISVTINGALIFTTSSMINPGLARTGVMVLSYDDEPVSDARFDNFRVTGIYDAAQATRLEAFSLPALLPAGPARPLPADVDWPWPTLDQIQRAFDSR